MELPKLKAKKLIFISLKFKDEAGDRGQGAGGGPSVGGTTKGGHTTADNSLLLARNPSKLEAASWQIPVNQLRILTNSYFSSKLPQHSGYCLLHSKHSTTECKRK